MIQILKSIPFFAHLPDVDLEAISKNVVMEYYPAGHVLFSEGDPGDKMYVIKSGSVEVIRGQAVIAELGTDRFFGEMALVSDGPRNATIKVKTDAELLVLTKDDFHHLLQTNPTIATMVSYEVVKRVNQND